ncbi:hypothetical protein F5148DRAFT_1255942, partial [Russula earlei]
MHRKVGVVLAVLLLNKKAHWCKGKCTRSCRETGKLYSRKFAQTEPAILWIGKGFLVLWELRRGRMKMEGKKRETKPQ